MIQSITAAPPQKFAAVTPPAPAGLLPTPRQYSQTASGLYLPSGASGLYIPSTSSLVAGAGLVIAPKSLVNDLSAANVEAHARQGYDNLARLEGPQFADFSIGNQLSLVDRVSAAERQRAVVDAFFANRVEYSDAPRATPAP